METYQVEFKCWNCKKINWITGIPKGVMVEDHCEDQECRVCGVSLIKPKEEKKDGKKGKE